MPNIPDEQNAPFQHLVVYCRDLFDEFRGSEYRKRKLEDAVESRRIYAQESRVVSEPWEGASNIELPLVAITVDNMEPRMVAGLVSQRPFVKLDIEGQDALNPEEEHLQDWFDRELQEIVGIESVAGDICHDAMLDGTVFVLPQYTVQTKRVRLMQAVNQQLITSGAEQLQRLSQVPPEQLPPEVKGQVQKLVEQMAQQARSVNGILVDEQGQPAWTDQEIREFEGAQVTFLKLSDVYMPDDVDDEDYEAAPIIRRVGMTYAELMRESQEQQAKGWVTKNITADLLGEQTSEDERIGEEERSPAQDVAEVEVIGKRVIPCIECYVSYMYREQGQNEADATDWTEERVVALITEQTSKLLRLRLLRDLNPMNNHLIRRIAPMRERGESLGSGVATKMRSIQAGATKAFNLAINTGEVKLLPFGFYEAKTGLHKLQGDKGELQLGIGKLLKVDSTQGLLFPQMNGDPNGFVAIMQIWMQFWERAFNIGDLQIGTNVSGAETATASLAKIQEGNIAHNYRSKRSKPGFLGLIQTIWDLYFAFLPLDKTMLVDGKQVGLPRQLMARGFKLRLTSSSEMSNKLIERKQSEDFATITGVTQMPGLWNLVKVAQDLAKSYHKDNPSEYVNPEIGQLEIMATQMPQLIPVMMQAAQQAIAMAQGIQEGGQAKAQSALAAGAMGGNGGMPEGSRPGPATGEAMMPKFAPQPRDVIGGML